jgi:hypothetical protein
MNEISVAATEFSRHFGKYQDDAFGIDVVKVTSHGRVVGAYLSARELAHYETLKRREREVFIVGQLPADMVADIEAAEYGVAPAPAV